ncbi:MAG TPA: HAMP domain-containing sensor histidine kinase [Segetibacter sp.]
MKTSARVASIFIFLFFIFFNGLQVYLILERISDTKTKFDATYSRAMVTTLTEYHKLKVIDSASTRTHAWIAYAPGKIELSRLDSQSVKLSAPFSSLVTDTVDLASIEVISNRQFFMSIDMDAFDRLFKKALHTYQVHADYRLDTISFQGRNLTPQMLRPIWDQKRRKEYPYATRPVRIPEYSNFAVIAQLKSDQAFFKQDLLWPMLAFAFILIIGNTALVFVYKTIRRQKRINEVKTDFINNITHEMKTPITIASAGLEALEHHISPTERTSFYLHTSKRQLHLLNDFVERILDSAVQDIAGFTLKKEKIDLHALFNELVQSHSVLQAKTVSFQLTGEGPAFIDGDRLHLQTAFHNIIDNAVKYSNGAVQIHIDIVQNNLDCTIKIRDNGMGIPPQFIKNVFEKFFRVPQGDAQSVKGFGLGLYYVSGIIKKHGGNITVHSQLQSGTEFIITLPKNA